MSKSTSRENNPATLDVLRGIAIISVLIGHAWPADLPKDAGRISTFLANAAECCGKFSLSAAAFSFASRSLRALTILLPVWQVRL